MRAFLTEHQVEMIELESVGTTDQAPGLHHLETPAKFFVPSILFKAQAIGRISSMSRISSAQVIARSLELEENASFVNISEEQQGFPPELT